VPEQSRSRSPAAVSVPHARAAELDRSRSAPTPSAFDPSARAACEGIFGLPHGVDESAVVLVPVPWEATASYGRGTRQAPGAIVRASWQIELYDPDTGRAYEQGIAMLRADDAIVDANARASAAAEKVIGVAGRAATDTDLARATAEVNQLGSWLNQHVTAAVGAWLDRGRLVGVVGGDHSSAFGAIAAHARRHPGLGLLHFDAHADLREAYEGFSYSHASVMERVLDELPEISKLVSVGLRDLCEPEHERIRGSASRIAALFDSELSARLFEGEPLARIAQGLVAELPADVYVSFDIDALDPALCPHTGTPVPGGLSFQQAVAILATVVRSGRRIVGFDLCEVAPGPDGDEWDANVGARLLYKLIGFALRSQGR
jgi:agmatinase